MFASSLEPRAKRRGIVLVVVLGMLGLMALIGVTFATFAGQSLIASRNFGQGVARPQAEALMDYALAQLINDTNNPVSAIRGHSLLRDMYGNDSVFRGSNPTANPASETGGVLSSVFIPNVGTQTLHFTNYQQRTSGNNAGTTAFYNQIEYQTNIPTGGQYYGLDFTRWIVRFPNNGNNFPTNAVSQTFEVLEDDASGAFHAFTLASNLINQTTDPNSNPLATTSGDWTPFIYSDPNQGATVSNSVASKGYTSLAKEISPSNNTFPPNYVGLSANSPSAPFVLYGQYMRAFNGAGLTQTSNRFVNGNSIDAYPYNLAAYGNFRLNGLDPDGIGMDEDYDACDLENWFLAIQSADGQVVIPSYHRPGILMATDWTSNNALVASKILRPRQADNSPLFPADPSQPDTATGKLTYDIDNDGDGVTDSVWVDLGYPVQRDPVGKIYKPLFAFMVLGLNGRLPLNTVGNLQARAIGDRTNTSSNATGQTYPNGNQLGKSSLNDPTGKADATTQVPFPGPLTGTMSPDSLYFQGTFSSQVYLDAPLWDHTSHLGYSANEINPKFALQNAPSNLYPNASVGATSGSVFGVYPQDYTSGTAPSYTQYDNAGVSVALTQLRNVLAGTVPTDIANPLSKSNLFANGSLNDTTLPKIPFNQEYNVAIVNGQPWALPNNVADIVDYQGGVNGVQRTLAAVAGRWGEVSGVPLALAGPTNNPALYSGGGGNQPLIYPMYWYNNPVRAGRSFYSLGANDVMDDDFDAFDPFLSSSAQSSVTYSLEASISGGSATQYQIPLNSTGYTANATFNRALPEFVDAFDSAGQMAVASERSRRFTRPIDVAGVGRQGIFQNSGADGLPLNRPLNDNDFGNGFDKRGRVRSFRYFRPAGLPQEIRYPYDNSLSYIYHYATNSGLGQQYLMPVLVPAGYSAPNGPAATYVIPSGTIPSYVTNPDKTVASVDLSNNPYSGFQAALTQYITNANVAQFIAPMGAMPYDWDVNNTSGAFNGTPTGGPPLGYGYTVDPVSGSQKAGISLLAPTINPSGALLSSINTDWGPKLTGVSTAYFINYGNLTGNSGQGAGDVVNGYVGSVYHNLNTGAAYIGGGSLNVDEADEMNLYASNLYDQPYGPSDLEWLYRLQDVDGSTLSSRLAKLAPVSFLNPADGLTRRRLFSTDSWELNRFAYANDNPNGNFNFNSRFLPNASPSLENLNQVVTGNLNVAGVNGFNPAYANPIATEFLPNPTIPPTQNSNTNNNNISLLIPNASQFGSGTTLPQPLTPHDNNSLFTNAFPTATLSNGVVVPFGNPSTLQVQTPSIAHGDRKINLNFPLPIANDPAEPVRQKWCRETYQLLKAILPPASIDTPEELAALSQFVVNIVDFRDTDCTMTRFVNTDLEVTDVLTRTADNTQHPGTILDPFDLTWSVSPSGVKFATKPIPAGHFPYDPSIYSPDGDPANHNAPTPFLVQHGMENNPIAINEAMAYEAQYGASTPTNPTPPLMTYQAMFIELVNTLTPEYNNPTLTSNASAVSLAGWDILLTPDNYGWGRPDPITGDINPIALPRYAPDSGGSVNQPPSPTKLQNATTTDPNLQQLQMAVQQYSFPGYPRGTANQLLTALYEYGQPDFYIIGDYRAGGASLVDITKPAQITAIEGASPVATAADINAPLPLTFQIPTPPAGTGQYYWIHLRRPANPFDIAAPNQQRPNKEMVVVDSMRFPVINAAVESLSGDPAMPTLNPATPVNAIYSAQRLQPYRGGHLLRVNTAVPTAARPTTGAASGTTTIAPPNPPYAYGYSEQMGTPPAGNGKAQYKTSSTTLYPTKTFQQSINDPNRGAGGVDSDWGHIPFNDRDFSSVAELLLVPGCPPGLFTKQFIEEPYPGNIFSDAAMTIAATGTDGSDLTSPIQAPPFVTVNTKDYSRVGNANFSNPNYAPPFGVPSHPTYPYLSDNFYYSAASVTPPASGNGLDAGYTHLTTEIGGWTGAGWHKMLEFFEVPSSANGAIGVAGNGNNYDWARSDLKPGLLNLNLVIDEEVFAGLIDDPRLNEILAYNSSTIPAVVTQIDSNGYPVFDNNQNSSTYGKVYGAQPVFSSTSVNPFFETSSATVKFFSFPAGRGYSLRDPDVAHYPGQINNANAFQPAQQLHGMKAAFADFLKLRHGGSGYLFAYGNGPTGSGDYPVPTLPNDNGTAYPVVQGYPYLVVPRTQPTQPVAAERPYRSLSFPDINMTIMRPASLPPSPVNSNNGTIITPGTTPPLPIVTSSYSTQLPDGTTLTAGLQNLGLYAGVTGFPYVQLEPARAPMAQKNAMSNPNGVNFQYVFDPGMKNPYLPIQFVNQDSPANDPVGSVHLAPPYATPLYTGAPPATATPAPFPPQIPPVPAARLFQIPDFTPTFTQQSSGYASGSSLFGQYNVAYLQYQANAANNATPVITDDQLAKLYTVNQQTVPQQLSTGIGAGTQSPPTLVASSRAVFLPDNITPQPNTTVSNFLGSTANNDFRQHPLYRTEWLQKVMNLTTVRTHQFAVWITVGFFEVVKPGTTELGIPDILGQELGLTAGKNVRYRSFFTLDRTKATGFNPYYPGNFRDVITYRRRIE